MLLAAVILLTLLNLKDLPGLLKRKRKKETVILVLLTICNIVLSVLVVMNVKFIMPQQLINAMMDRIFGKFSLT